MGIKQNLFDKLETTHIGKRLVTEPRYRAVATAALSFSFNLLYALYHGALGIAGRSLWFLAMCAYYTLLSTMRFSAILCERKSKSAGFPAAEYFMAKLSGILLAALSFVLAGVIYISLAENIAAKYAPVLMITIAAYTFCKLTMAILRAAKQRKDPSPLLAALRRIGYAEVAASIVTLQRSMFASFGSADHFSARRMDLLTGAAVCIFVFMLGVTIITKGTKRKGASLWQSLKS